jgi:hypothetical protein
LSREAPFQLDEQTPSGSPFVWPHTDQNKSD